MRKTQPIGAQRFAQDLFSGLPSHYDLLAEVLSFGQNRRWRHRLSDAISSVRPLRVLDVATGTAGVAMQIHDKSGSHVIGVDITEDMVRKGVTNVEGKAKQSSIDFVVGNAMRLPFADASFDALSFTYLLRYVPDPQETMSELARIVRPGGIVANLEFHVPANAFWRSMWRLYTRLVLPVAGLLTGGSAWWRVGRFLGPNIDGFYRHHPLEAVVRYWEKADIGDVHVETMSLGGGVVMWGTKAVQ